MVDHLTTSNFGLDVLRGFLVELYGRMRVHSKLLLFAQRFALCNFPLTLTARQLALQRGVINFTFHCALMMAFRLSIV